MPTMKKYLVKYKIKRGSIVGYGEIEWTSSNGLPPTFDDLAPSISAYLMATPMDVENISITEVSGE